MSRMEDAVNQERDDGIDLMVLFRVFVEKKWLVVSVASVVTLCAIGYALLATPVYKVTTGVLPPMSVDLGVLNADLVRDLTGGASPETAFSSFLQKVKSKKVRWALFDEMGLRNRLLDEKDADVPDDWVFQKFDELISVLHPIVNKEQTYLSPRVVLSLEGEDPVLSAEVLNKLVERADQAAVQALVSDVRSIIDLRVDALTREVQLLRSTAFKRRMDYIAELDEAALMARTLGISDPVEFNIEKINAAKPGSFQVLTEVTAPQSGLYSRGYEALEAEAKQLRERKSDDPFIRTLRDKEADLEKIKQIAVDPAGLHAARVDQLAYVPEKRLKPRRARIVLAGGFLGIMLGCGLALLIHYSNLRFTEDAR